MIISVLSFLGMIKVYLTVFDFILPSCIFLKFILLLLLLLVLFYHLNNDDVLLLSCEKDMDFGKLPFKVLKIIEPLKKSPMKTF